jgi:D-alanyl-D-alanine dipeptidase
MANSTYTIILKQYSSSIFYPPTIADRCITCIPLHDCGEELIDIATIKHARISVMNDDDILLAHEREDDIDYRSPKHSFVRKSVYLALEHMILELDRLAPHFGYEPGELCIRLFEGLRDLETQKILFDGCLLKIRQQNPSLSYSEAYNETCKWVSPYIMNIPTHSTGAAIDIHLWSDKVQCFCEMGRFNAGEYTAPTFSTHPSITAKQIKNRFLFLVAATEAGLINYTFEWWHYSLGDRYASYWRNQPFAIYNIPIS